MLSARPVKKLAASGVAGAITVLALALLRSTTHLNLDADAQNALVVLISFALGYLIPPNPADIVVTHA